MKYSKFLWESLYKSLTMVSKKKKKTNKFRIKMQKISSTKTLATVILFIPRWKKKK